MKVKPCRFLAIVRSPYAVCEGVRRREGRSIEEAAHHWATGNKILFDDLPRLERSWWFRYEDLCARPQEHLKRLEDFLELKRPFEYAVLDRLEAHNVLGAPSALQDFNERSMARLSSADRDTIHRIAGDQMKRLGYPLVDLEESP